MSSIDELTDEDMNVINEEKDTKKTNVAKKTLKKEKTPKIKKEKKDDVIIEPVVFGWW